MAIAMLQRLISVISTAGRLVIEMLITGKINKWQWITIPVISTTENRMYDDAITVRKVVNNEVGDIINDHLLIPVLALILGPDLELEVHRQFNGLE